jgi:protein-S-isoprenylcysteine O-methyltransferase Ste14
MNQAALWNLALIALFGLQHSIMAREWFKRRFRPPRPRLTYVLASVAALVLLWRFWQPMPDLAWRFQGWVAIGLYIVWTFGLQLVLFGAISIDWRELLGFKEPGPPQFRTPFLYTLVRHPIYLGLILMLWSSPTMSMGRLLFATGMTLYILIGIYFEERDLERIFGDVYRVYQRRVPMLIPGWRRE